MRTQKQKESDNKYLSSLSDAFVHELRHLVETERNETMMSMPAERVMRALRRPQSWNTEEVWLAELFSWFRPVFVAGLFVVIALAFYNIQLLSNENEFEQSAAEMVFGLPPVTLASAYDIHLDDHP
ncbi:MAG: hypothetical protein O3B41_03835 [Bacteroidetes bacterium]|nr:hypothetical protein [Bacteroidota bacterium]